MWSVCIWSAARVATSGPLSLSTGASCQSAEAPRRKGRYQMTIPTPIDVESLRANLAAVLDAIDRGDTAQAAAIVAGTMTALEVAYDQMREPVIAARWHWVGAGGGRGGRVKH